MKTIRIPLDQFDLGTFLNKTIDYLSSEVSSEVHPTYGIVWVDRLGDVPVYGPESGWDVLSGLKEEGKSVFFPFAHADDHGLLDGADGKLYRPVCDDAASDTGLLIGPEDSIGYLVQLKGGDLIINSAIHAGGAHVGPLPSVDLWPDCQILDDPMERFIEGFMQSKILPEESTVEEPLDS